MSEKSLTSYLSIAIEYGIYVYAFLTFFDKGEAIRNICLYGAFTAWLLFAAYTKKMTFSRNIISIGVLAYILSCVLSSVFSIEPGHSFDALRKDMLKPVIAFLIVSTFFTFPMVVTLCRVFCLGALVILVMGLHGFFMHQTGLYTPDNLFLSLDKNEFGFLLSLLLPFLFMFFVTGKGQNKLFWGATSLWGLSSTLLSASRGSIAAVLTEIIIWKAAFFRKLRWKAILAVIVVLILTIVIAFQVWPEDLIKERILLTPEHIGTLTFRTEYFWTPAMEAIKQRPLVGWGYGKAIYRDPRPFQQGEKPHWNLQGGLHSTFITVLFHQGFVGFLAYLFLLCSTVVALFMVARSSRNEEKALAVALLSVLVGAFIVNALLLSVPFRRLAFITAMSAVLLRENLAASPDLQRRHEKSGTPLS